jgi:hypothetical protein
MISLEAHLFISSAGKNEKLTIRIFLKTAVRIREEK